jgi:hypothetical protein
VGQRHRQLGYKVLRGVGGHLRIGWLRGTKSQPLSSPIRLQGAKRSWRSSEDWMGEGYKEPATFIVNFVTGYTDLRMGGQGGDVDWN